MKKEYKKIPIKRDKPAFSQTTENSNNNLDEELEKDQFDFKVYAETLMKIIQNNGPSLLDY